MSRGREHARGSSAPGHSVAIVSSGWAARAAIGNSSSVSLKRQPFRGTSFTRSSGIRLAIPSIRSEVAAGTVFDNLKESRSWNGAACGNRASSRCTIRVRDISARLVPVAVRDVVNSLALPGLPQVIANVKDLHGRTGSHVVN